MLKRKLNINIAPNESFFLWGARQSGKSTLLRQQFPEARRINLLESDTFVRYATQPSLLREELRALHEKPRLIIIDEVQKVPQLLDEVHLLIEEDHLSFGLCGSSARKLKRGHANMLGGRALRFELTGLSASEIPNWDLVQLINTGYLPRHYLNPQRAPEYLNSYVNDYLKEEIAAEGLVRNLPTFADFLSAAALSDSEVVNFSTIARDVGVSSQTVRDHFEILTDTLIGHWLPAWRKRPKRKTQTSPKFYFDDVGVVNHLAKRGKLVPGSAIFGKAFENWVYHELLAWKNYLSRGSELSFWRLSEKVEVDFIVDDMRVAIEAKASSRIHSDHLVGLRQLQVDNPNVAIRIVVCLETKRRLTEDGILIMPVNEFLDDLWSGAIS
jgi:predicted AAA+ superfamily ATPase